MHKLAQIKDHKTPKKSSNLPQHFKKKIFNTKKPGITLAFYYFVVVTNLKEISNASSTL